MKLNLKRWRDGWRPGRALIQIGKKEEALKVLRSKILGSLLVVSKEVKQDTIIKGLFLMLIATSND